MCERQTKASPQAAQGKQPSDEPELAARLRRSRSPVEGEVSHGRRWVPVKLHWRNSPEVTPKTTPTASPRKGISTLRDPPPDTVDAQTPGDASCKLSPVANLLSSSPSQVMFASQVREAFLFKSLICCSCAWSYLSSFSFLHAVHNRRIRWECLDVGSLNPFFDEF